MSSLCAAELLFTRRLGSTHHAASTDGSLAMMARGRGYCPTAADDVSGRGPMSPFPNALIVRLGISLPCQVMTADLPMACTVAYRR
jgi:hypothetical protein